MAGSNVLCRFLGFVFRIPLANWIGAEGMGYYGFAHQILHVVSAVTFAGLSPALVQLTAAAPVDLRRSVLRSARGLFTALGLIATLVLLLFGGMFCRLAGSEASRYALWVLAPTALLSAWEAADRSYFQGCGALKVPAAAQLADSLCKLVSGTAAAVWLHRQAYPTYIVAAGAIFGVTFGTLISTLVLMRGVRRECVPRKFRVPVRLARETRRKLLRTAAPLAFGAVMLSVTGSLEASVIVSRLQSLGLSPAEAARSYGAYTGIAQTVYSLPFAITSAICTAVIPAVAHGGLSDPKNRAFLHTAFRLTGVVVWFAAALFAVFPHELLSLLFSRGDDVAIAAPLLRILAAATVLSAICSLLAAALHAVGSMKLPLAAMALGSGVRILTAAVLIGRPEFAVGGAAVGTVVCFAIAAAVNGIALAGKWKYVPPFLPGICKPAACALISVAGGKAFAAACAVGSARVQTLLALATAALLYLLLLAVTKTVRKEDGKNLRKSVF